VPTALSSTEVAGPWRRRWDDARRAAWDVAPLIEFRVAAVRGRRRWVAGAALVLMVALTVVFAWVPAHVPGAAGTPGLAQFRSDEAILILPTAYLGVLVIAVVSAASAGGGRELLPRDQAVVYPVSPTTDHLGALVMAPLNIAWLLQSWAVLALTAYVFGPHNLIAVQLPVLVWLVVATAVAQLVAWLAEWLRRVRYGVWVLRAVVAAVVAGAAWLILAGELVGYLDGSPTIRVLLTAYHGSEGSWAPWARGLLLLLVLAVVAVVAGGLAAHVLSRRPPREEMRVETSVHARRPNPASDLVAMLRVDRAGVWRSVPLRRGFAVLALLPGLVALASALEWYMLNVLPGLVASGGALLFGVNSWCLDGRGALWRESLPVTSRLAFVTRVVVLLEVLLAAVAISLLLASLRAGAPTATQVVAVVCASLVVTLQVVAGSMRWSVRRPFAVDMRSARATPAPPLSMVGYSTRLALVTTFTAMLFVATSRAPSWHLSVLIAVPFILFSLLRLARTADSWARPEVRSQVVTTVAS
jgi:hypothetical protein